MQSAEELLLGLLPDERGRVIAVLRSSRRLSRDELAKLAKVSPNTIGDWEKGEVKSPRVLYPKLHAVFNVTLPILHHALSIVRHPVPASEVREKPGEYEHAKSGEVDASAGAERSLTEIEEEISDRYAEIGRLKTRIHLLQTELAVRHGILRSRG